MKRVLVINIIAALVYGIAACDDAPPASTTPGPTTQTVGNALAAVQGFDQVLQAIDWFSRAPSTAQHARDVAAEVVMRAQLALVDAGCLAAEIADEPIEAPEGHSAATLSIQLTNCETLAGTHLQGIVDAKVQHALGCCGMADYASWYLDVDVQADGKALAGVAQLAPYYVSAGGTSGSPFASVELSYPDLISATPLQASVASGQRLPFRDHAACVFMSVDDLDADPARETGLLSVHNYVRCPGYCPVRGDVIWRDPATSVPIAQFSYDGTNALVATNPEGGTTDVMLDCQNLPAAN